MANICAWICVDRKRQAGAHSRMSQKAQIWLQRAGETTARPIGVGEVEGRLERNAQVKFTYIQKEGRSIEAGDVGAPLSQSVADATMTATKIKHSRAWLERNKSPDRVGFPLGAFSGE